MEWSRPPSDALAPSDYWTPYSIQVFDTSLITSTWGVIKTATLVNHHCFSLSCWSIPWNNKCCIEACTKGQTWQARSILKHIVRNMQFRDKRKNPIWKRAKTLLLTPQYISQFCRVGWEEERQCPSCIISKPQAPRMGEIGSRECAYWDLSLRIYASPVL